MGGGEREEEGGKSDCGEKGIKMMKRTTHLIVATTML